MNCPREVVEGPVIALIATVPRPDILCARALPSVGRQTLSPAALVIVADRRALTVEEEAGCARLLPLLPLYFLANERASGVAGAWNTGLDFISSQWSNAYVAILDDDDEWAPNHLQSCWECARENRWPDAVVSGLTLDRDGMEVPRSPPLALQIQDFLVGNPGWQGSNTFVSLPTMLAAGCFTEGLASTNDRDLAIRILALPQVRLAFTGRHTATWHIDSDRNCLSSRGSPEKRRGLAHFFMLHGHRMTPTLRDQFFHRARQLFDLTPEDIQQGWDEGEHV